MEVKFGAVVRRMTKVITPILDTAGKPTGKQEEVDCDVTDDPVTDDAGNPIEGGSAEAVIRAIIAKYKNDTNTEVLQVWVRKTETVQNLQGSELQAAAGA